MHAAGIAVARSLLAKGLDFIFVSTMVPLPVQD
jgi:hypothetical protein